MVLVPNRDVDKPAVVLELKYDKYERVYTLSVYDKYGHFIDDVQLTKEDVRNMYESLDAVKNTL